ncbi:MarR family winged helix-turn-helix transcriptional regulator [Actinomadura parmotrematis]|uniref:MarR family transcriptional regulator n=1 Tax=Actinomadura parmotrematis TaxID=2864039 RepID=A0ABS7G1J8_9ACTN|nr:MarR family transcriptional regulator [Actinomadura parmotrematis]MBW8486568.1 MarR family transcriptional regulator [Actinomadura parmotrematis]
MDPNELGFGDLSALGPLEEWPIGRLFAAAARKSGPVFMRMVESHGVSPAGFLLLRVLSGCDGARAGDVARNLMITPASVTSVADTLERDGLLERRRDGEDRRVVRLHITESGLAVVKVTNEAMAPDFWHLYNVVDPEDEPAVRRFLLRLIDRFDDFLEGERG